MTTEVGWWRSFLKSTNKQEAEATEIDVAAFFLTDKMVKASIAARLSCFNALNQYYRERHTSNPFLYNPYPYPLLKRYVPDFNLLYAQVSDLCDELRPYGLLILLCRLSIDEVYRFDISNITDIGIKHEDRLIPLKKKDLDDILSCFRKPIKNKIYEALCGYRLQDFHSATIAHLFENGITEDVVMAIYGRQSAMKVAVAKHKVNIFRVRLEEC